MPLLRFDPLGALTAAAPLQVNFLLHTMKSEPEFQYFVWVDDDIFISNLDCAVTSLIAPFEERCLGSIV